MPPIEEMTPIGKALWRAAEDAGFRSRTLHNLGAALAEEGFILSDEEMTTLRRYWEPLFGLPERAAYERIMALARMYGR